MSVVFYERDACMKALIQRVSSANVAVDGDVVGNIAEGLVVLLGIATDDTGSEVEYLVDKLLNLRIFEDEGGKMNLCLKDVGGSVLIISQFTLYADCRKGRRPSFTDAARPEKAISLYDAFIKKVESSGVAVETGIFGACMQVEINNDGPVTIMLEK